MINALLRSCDEFPHLFAPMLAHYEGAPGVLDFSSDLPRSGGEGPVGDQRANVFELVHDATVDDVFASLASSDSETLSMLAFGPVEMRAVAHALHVGKTHMRVRSFFLVEGKKEMRIGLYCPFPGGYGIVRSYPKGSVYRLRGDDGYRFIVRSPE